LAASHARAPIVPALREMPPLAPGTFSWKRALKSKFRRQGCDAGDTTFSFLYYNALERFCSIRFIVSRL
jgi:hypothetical protein